MSNNQYNRRRLTFSALQREQMERTEKRTGTRMRLAHVSQRRPVGASGSTYSVDANGATGSGLASMQGDFEPGDTVLVSQMGDRGGLSQILGAAPTNYRATQNEITTDTDVTSAVLR